MLKNTKKIIVIFLTLMLLFSTFSVLADEVTPDAVNPSVDATTTEVTTPDAVAPDSNATDANAANNTMNEDNYKKGDVYLTSAEPVTINYIVDGNLYVMADTVTINSQIGGDAFICAKKIIIGEEGYVFNNLFALAESLEIKGVVYDVYACTQNLTISNGYVYRDLRATSSNITINGAVGRNAFISCNDLKFNTEENQKAIIYGDLNYSAPNEVTIPENIVSGKVEFTKLEENVTPIQAIISSYILSLGMFLVLVLLVWLIMLKLTPKFLENTNKFIGKSTLKVLGIGLLSPIVLIVAAILLCVLVIGIKAGLVVLLITVLAFILSTVLAAITINKYICSKLNVNKNIGIVGVLIITTTVLWGLMQIPYLGTIVSLALTIFGFGIITTSLLPKKQEKEKVVEDTKVSKKETKTKKDSK